MLFMLVILMHVLAMKTEKLQIQAGIFNLSFLQGIDLARKVATRRYIPKRSQEWTLLFLDFES